MPKHVAAESPSSAEPANPAESRPDSSRLENSGRRRTPAQVLWNRALSWGPSDGEPVLGAPEASEADLEEVAPRGLNIPSPEELSRAASAAVDDGKRPDRARHWRRGLWAALGLALILPAAIALAITFPVLRFAGPNEVDGDARSGKSNPRRADWTGTSPAPFAAPAAAPPSVVADRPDTQGSPAPIAPEREARSTDVDPGALDMNPTATVPTTPPTPPAVVADRSEAKLGSASALLPEGMPPRVLIRYLGSSAGARKRAETLAKTLAGNGVEVADVRESPAAIRNELSFAYAPDQSIARRIGRLAGITPTRAALSNDGLTVRPGMIQLSISGR